MLPLDEEAAPGLPESAKEWIASASIALEPVATAAPLFASAIAMFAPSAYRIARTESALPTLEFGEICSARADDALDDLGAPSLPQRRGPLQSASGTSIALFRNRATTNRRSESRFRNGSRQSFSLGSMALSATTWDSARRQTVLAI